MATPARVLDHKHLIVLRVVANEYRERFVSGAPIPHEVSFGILDSILDFEREEPERFKELYRTARALEGLERRRGDFSERVRKVVTALESAGKEFHLVKYDRETTTCKDKEEMWKEQGVQAQFPLGLGMVKSILLKYVHKGNERYILACTTSDTKVNLDELRREFRLSHAESRTLTHRGIEEIDLVGIVGQSVGEVGPLLINPQIEELDGIYWLNLDTNESYREKVKMELLIISQN